jgi:hypothetical protein
METSTLQDGLAEMKMPELNHENMKLVSAARASRNEQSDPGFADEHDGETFEEFYAEGPCESAFGNCLAAKTSVAAGSS